MKFLRVTTRGRTKKDRVRDGELNLDVVMSLDQRTDKLGPLLLCNII